MVGGFAGYIAWRQWQTARQRLRFDLFEKRFGIYLASVTLINRAVVHGTPTMEDIVQFQQATRGGEFLFSGPAKAFIRELGANAIRARLNHDQLDRNANHPRADHLINEEEDIGDYLRSKADEVDGLFRPYLDLSEIAAK